MSKKESKKETKKMIGTVIGGANLNVRSEAKKGNNITGELACGQTVDLIGIDGEWAEIKSGFVMKEFLKIETVSETVKKAAKETEEEDAEF